MDPKLKAYITKRIETLMPASGYYTAKGAAHYLGISTTTFWRWRKKGFVAPIFIDGIQLFKRKDLDDLVESRAKTGW